jgi:TPR repeat protein
VFFSCAAVSLAMSPPTSLLKAVMQFHNTSTQPYPTLTSQALPQQFPSGHAKSSPPPPAPALTALQFLKTATALATRSSPFALAALGYARLFGYGTQRDCKRAYDFYQRAVRGLHVPMARAYSRNTTIRMEDVRPTPPVPPS